MYRSGAYVADYVTSTTPDQIQPNGVDLTLAAVYEQNRPGRISRDDKTIGDRRTISQAGQESMNPAPAGQAGTSGQGGVYQLAPGGFIVQYGETITVPDGHIGFILPRSSLLRNSCMLNTAVWDAGYEGRGEGLLQVHHEIEIEAEARIGQFVLAEANHETTYTGSYQHENL